MAKAMEIKLTKAGFNVTVVLNGDDGLLELERDVYDLVILDILMPVVDGWRVLEEIKEKDIKVKVIVISNLSQPEDKKRAMELGASDYMVKTESSLANIVDRVRSFLYAS